MSYAARILQALKRLGSNGTSNPDTAGPASNNIEPAIGDAFLWDEVERYAKRESAKAWTAIERDHANTLERIRQRPGEHTVADSPHFIVTARVSDPVRRFNVDALADLLLNSKYKVPKHVTVELCNLAKVPGKSSMALAVRERSVE